MAIDLIEDCAPIAYIGDTAYVVSDAPASIAEAVDNLSSLDGRTRLEAWRYLYPRYPAEMTQFLGHVMRQVAVAGTTHRISDGASVFSTVKDVASIFIPAVSAVVDVVSGIFGNIFGGGAPADPNHSGRSVTDARTWLEELTAVYKTAYAPRGNAATPYNYSTVIYVPKANVPHLDQNFFDPGNPGTHGDPTNLYLSWDGAGTWPAGFKDSRITQQPGAAVSFSFQEQDGSWHDAPGYYVAQQYTDGAIRFDYLGTSIPASVSNQTQVKQQAVGVTTAGAYTGQKPTVGVSVVTSSGTIQTGTTSSGTVTVTPGQSTPGQAQQTQGGLDVSQIMALLLSGDLSKLTPEMIALIVGGTIPMLTQLYNTILGKPKNTTEPPPIKAGVSPAVILPAAGVALFAFMH